MDYLSNFVIRIEETQIFFFRLFWRFYHFWRFTLAFYNEYKIYQKFQQHLDKNAGPFSWNSGIEALQWHHRSRNSKCGRDSHEVSTTLFDRLSVSQTEFSSTQSIFIFHFPTEHRKVYLQRTPSWMWTEHIWSDLHRNLIPFWMLCVDDKRCILFNKQWICKQNFFLIQLQQSRVFNEYVAIFRRSLYDWKWVEKKSCFEKKKKMFLLSRWLEK